MTPLSGPGLTGPDDMPTILDLDPSEDAKFLGPLPFGQGMLLLGLAVAMATVGALIFGAIGFAVFGGGAFGAMYTFAARDGVRWVRRAMAYRGRRRTAAPSGAATASVHAAAGMAGVDEALAAIATEPARPVAVWGQSAHAFALLRLPSTPLMDPDERRRLANGLGRMAATAAHMGAALDVTLISGLALPALPTAESPTLAARWLRWVREAPREDVGAPSREHALLARVGVPTPDPDVAWRIAVRVASGYTAHGGSGWTWISAEYARRLALDALDPGAAYARHADAVSRYAAQAHTKEDAADGTAAPPLAPPALAFEFSDGGA